MVMTIGVYSIFNAETDECLYVGLSKDIEDRWQSHLKNLQNKRHPRKDFVEWYHTNGAKPELIVFRILEECNNDDFILNTLEIKWFKELSPKYYGQIPSLKNRWTHSEETRKKIGDSNSTKTLIKLKNNHDTIVKMANDLKYTLKDIQNEVGVSKHSLVKYMKKNNINHVYKNWNKKDLESYPIKKWRFEDKKTIREIAKLANTTHPTILNYLKKLNL